MSCRASVETQERGSSAAFTFLEVLVALCVVSISIVALLNCHTISLRNYRYSQVLSRATLLAEEKINEIESRGFPEIDEDYAQEYDNGRRYVVEEQDVYACPRHPDVMSSDPDERCPRCDGKLTPEYWWRSTVEETEYEGLRMVTVEVFSQRFARQSVYVDAWDEEQISPKVRLVTYIATTNQREDSRSGSAQTSSTQRRAR